jgi:DNA modification methylase
MHYANMDAVRQPYAESTMRELAAEVYNGKPKKDYASSGAQNPSDAKARFIKRHSIRAGVDNKGGGQGSGQIEIKDLGGSNLRTVWPIPTQASNGEHTAAFPDRLAELCILMGCPPGGVVLDLFGGSGTTITVSLRHGRSALMIELNPKYCEMARRRIINDNPLFNTPALAPSTSPALKEAPAP